MPTGVAGIGEVCESDDDCTTKDSFCDDGICVCNDGFVFSVSGMQCLGMIVPVPVSLSLSSCSSVNPVVTMRLKYDVSILVYHVQCIHLYSPHNVVAQHKQTTTQANKNNNQKKRQMKKKE